MVQGAGCRVQGVGFRIQGSGFKVWGSGVPRAEALEGRRSEDASYAVASGETTLVLTFEFLGGVAAPSVAFFGARTPRSGGPCRERVLY